MGSARRLYLYTVSAVSLLVLSIGLVNLVAVVLGEISDALGASVIGVGTTGREQVSLAIALVIVGTPIFALHWWLVSRGWRGTDASGLEDRRSTVRALHLGLVSTVALGVAVFAALQIVDGGLKAVLGVDESDGGRASDDWAILVVATPIWWWHWRRRNLDIRHDRMAGSAAWLTRLHRYGWAFIGLMLPLIGASQILETTASVLIGRPGFGTEESWWLGSLAWAIAMVVVGLVVFVVHAFDARDAIRDAADIGTDERATGLRAAYFAAVILVTLAYGSVTVAGSLAALLRLVLGVAEDASTAGLLEGVVGPLLVALPFAVAGWLHWAGLRRESIGRGSVAAAAAWRLVAHLVALVGLAFLAFGTARLIGRLLEVALGSTQADEFFRYEIAWFIGQVVVGAALWIPAWTAILRHRAADPTVERDAAVGRAYLYLVVAAALIAAVPSAAFTLYRLIDTMLGGRGSGLGSDVALPIAAVVVAGAVALYHGRLVVADLRASTSAPAAMEGAALDVVAPPGPTGTAAPAASVNEVVLTLRGASGTDLAAVAAHLRTQLPPGVVLDGP